MDIVSYLENELKLISNTIFTGEDFSKKIKQISHNLIHNEDGIKLIGSRKERSIKKFLEELVPLDLYIRFKSNPFHNIKVKWINSNQNYDAVLYTFKSNVFQDEEQNKSYIEITTAITENSHLAREFIDEHGYCYAAKNTKRIYKSREITSTPYSYTNDEHITDIMKLIEERIIDKQSKKYPDRTDLIIYIETDMIIHNSEWKDLLRRIISKYKPAPFKEIILINKENNFVVSI